MEREGIIQELPSTEQVFTWFRSGELEQFLCQFTQLRYGCKYLKNFQGKEL